MARGRRAGRAKFADDALALLDGEDAVNGGQRQFLHRTARPVNLDILDSGGVAEAKVHTLVVGRDVASTAQHVTTLAHTTGSEIYGGAHCIARTFGAACQPELNPMVAVVAHVAQQHRMVIDHIDHHIDLSVVEEVAEGSASS